MNKLSLPAAAAGGVTAVLSARLLSLPLGPPAGASQPVQGDALGLLQGSPGRYALQLLAGALCAVLGGYVAALIARREEVRNGALASCLCIVYGLYVLTLASGSDPAAVQLALIVASPFLAAAGGWLRLKQAQGGYGARPGYGRQHHA